MGPPAQPPPSLPMDPQQPRRSSHAATLLRAKLKNLATQQALTRKVLDAYTQELQDLQTTAKEITGAPGPGDVLSSRSSLRSGCEEGSSSSDDDSDLEEPQPPSRSSDILL